MAFTGDFHTHSVYSHGKGSVEDNVLAAREKGLKTVVISDHGVCVYPNNIHPSDVNDYLLDIKACREKYPDIEILSGVESNLLSNDGDIDLPEEAEDALDWINFGFHLIRMPDKAKSFFGFWLPNATFSFDKAARVAKNTDAYIKTMERYRVSAIAHPCKQIALDLKALGEAARDLGVYVEINTKNCVLERHDFETLGKTGCEFICSSDAHSPDVVGDFSAVRLFDGAGLDRKLIANWDRSPKIRARKNASSNS